MESARWCRKRGLAVLSLEHLRCRGPSAYELPERSRPTAGTELQIFHYSKALNFTYVLLPQGEGHPNLSERCSTCSFSPAGQMARRQRS